MVIAKLKKQCILVSVIAIYYKTIQRTSPTNKIQNQNTYVTQDPIKKIHFEKIKLQIESDVIHDIKQKKTNLGNPPNSELSLKFILLP